jgi:protein SCO1
VLLDLVLRDELLVIFSRRKALHSATLLGFACALSNGFSGGLAREALAHNDPGRVLPPQPAPALSLTLHDGRKAQLKTLLAGRVTALQLMFTGCSATCPIQGALFSQVQELTKHEKGLQLISVSIDPLSDDPKAMRAWLSRFGAKEHWLGATPDLNQLDAWLEFLRARNKGVDRHTPQVYFFNSLGELALRSTDFPAPEDIARLMKAAQASTQLVSIQKKT